MADRMSFRYLKPVCFAGLLDDPVLWVGVRPWGRALLFDCGQLHHLAKRVLKSLGALFVTHCHMDHFMGFDTLVRHVLVSPRCFDVFGPPGLADKIEHKLAAYDWNLHESFWCTFRVHEIFPDRICKWTFPGPLRFVRRSGGVVKRNDASIFVNRWVRVEAAQADHRIPVLVYRISEQPGFAVDAARIAAEGLQPGPWIGELSRQFNDGKLGKKTLAVIRTDDDPAEIEDTDKLYRAIKKNVTPSSVGYMTDVGFSADNIATAADMLEGVTLLVGECAFLADHREKARRSFHLCTEDMNLLLEKIRPGFYLPVHLSKSCGSRRSELYRELHPPAGTRILHLPERLLPRPLLPDEVRLEGVSRGA